MNDLGISYSKEEIKGTGKAEAMELGNGDYKTDIAAMKQFEIIRKGDCGKIQEKFKCI